MDNNVTFKFETKEDKQRFLAWFMDCGGDQSLSDCLEIQGNHDMYVSNHTGYCVGQEHLEAVIELSTEKLEVKYKAIIFLCEQLLSLQVAGLEVEE